MPDPQRPPFRVAVAGRGIAKRFGHVEALCGADVEVRHGQVVALLGDNGAGKSTLLKTLLGVVRADRGEVVVQDEDVELGSVRDVQRRGVECVYQDLALAPDLSVAASLFLGREPLLGGLRGRLGILARREMAERAERALQELSIPLSSGVAIGELSAGQRQAVAVARAVMWARTAVLMDEPTAALGARQSDLVYALIRTVASRGLGVLLVSHDLPRALEVADRVAILAHGMTVHEGPADELSVPDAVGLMVGYRRAG